MPTYQITWTVKITVTAEDETDAVGNFFVKFLESQLLPDEADLTVKEVK